jgi:nitroreductase
MTDVPPFDLAEVDRLLTTTRAVRRRLDLRRPVPRDVVTECIRLASHAPNASNSQEWRWVVVDDPDLRRRVGAEYRRVIESRVRAMRDAKAGAGDADGVRISESVLYLAERMADVPVLVMPCYETGEARDRYTRLDNPEMPDGARQLVMYASIIPAVWSFQLALRSRGLGSTLTTAHHLDQPAFADVLGLPSSWEQVALVPVAYTTGGDFTPARRKAVEDLIVWNHT